MTTAPTPARPATGVWLFPDAPTDALVDAAIAAEELGIEEVWFGDEGIGRDPFVVLAAVARHTSRIRLGVAVTNPYLRHPAVTATTSLTIQELSGGRFTLGLGAGGGLALDPVGVRRSRPVDRIRDAVRITRAVAAGRSTDGYTAPAHALPPQPLTVVIGARGERLNRLASEVADGVFLGGIPLCAIPDAIAWATSERPIPVVLSIVGVFDDDAYERLRPNLLWTLLDAPTGTRGRLGISDEAVRAAAQAAQRGDDAQARRVVDDRIASQLALRGDPRAMGLQLRSIVTEFAPASIVLNLHANGDPVGAVMAAGVALAGSREQAAVT